MSLRIFSLFTNATRKEVAAELLQILTSNFENIRARSDLQPVTVRTFVDASAASVIKYLPDGPANPDKDYHFVKTDASGNTVTILPYGTQSVMATTSLVLTAQGDSAWLSWDNASQSWWLM